MKTAPLSKMQYGIYVTCVQHMGEVCYNIPFLFVLDGCLDEEKLKALGEAKRITKKGGIILVAYVMNEYSVISYCFKEHKWSEVAAKGGLSPDFHTLCKEDELYDIPMGSRIVRLAKNFGLM